MSTTKDLRPIRGTPPDPRDVPPGCPYHPRCPQAEPVCWEEHPALESSRRRLVACHFGGLKTLLAGRDLQKTFRSRGGRVQALRGGLTGCTFGKGNLVYHDHGKVVFTFLRRSDGRAVRVSMRDGAFGPDDDERQSLEARVRGGAATDEDRRRFWELQRERSQLLLETPVEELFDVREVNLDPPRAARIHTSIACSVCGEPTMETRIRQIHGQQVCTPCFEQRLAGRTPVQLSPGPGDVQDGTGAT